MAPKCPQFSVAVLGGSVGDKDILVGRAESQ